MGPWFPRWFGQRHGKRVDRCGRIVPRPWLTAGFSLSIGFLTFGRGRISTCSHTCRVDAGVCWDDGACRAFGSELGAW